MVPLRAILVCVDYADFLSVTLPWNRHHFDEVMVVTAPRDTNTYDLAKQYDCKVHLTDSFWTNGAKFNKWVALEEGLTNYGRKGWLCVMDADVLWPAQIQEWEPLRDSLHTPFRRMYDGGLPVPEEKNWHRHPRHRIVSDFSGYTQIFHAEDRHLGPAPWHEVDWSHAGGADTFFQDKWPASAKVRPPFEVLHLGIPGTNWCGRVTASFLDGSRPPDAEKRMASLRGFMAERQRRGKQLGIRDYHDQRLYEHEKLK